MYESCFTRYIHIKSIRCTHKEPNASAWTACAYWVSLKLRGAALALVYSSPLKRKPPLCRCATPSNHNFTVIFGLCRESFDLLQNHENQPSNRGYSASCVLEAGLAAPEKPSLGRLSERCRSLGRLTFAGTPPVFTGVKIRYRSPIFMGCTRINDAIQKTGRQKQAAITPGFLVAVDAQTSAALALVYHFVIASLLKSCFAILTMLKH